MKPKKIVIWDFDGTLAWRTGGWTGALLSVLRCSTPELNPTAEMIRPMLQSGFPWQAPENAHPGLDADEWWEELVPLFARAFRAAGIQNGRLLELAYEVRGAYLDPAAWQRFDDTLPTLKALTNRGWAHVLLTNHVPELPQLLELLGLNQQFAAIFNSAETGYEKPNPKAFRNVLDWAGPGVTAWVVGDSYPADYLGASENELPAILVRSNHPGASPCCRSLSEVLAVLP